MRYRLFGGKPCGHAQGHRAALMSGFRADSAAAMLLYQPAFVGDSFFRVPYPGTEQDPDTESPMYPSVIRLVSIGRELIYLKV